MVLRFCGLKAVEPYPELAEGCAVKPYPELAEGCAISYPVFSEEVGQHESGAEYSHHSYKSAK